MRFLIDNNLSWRLAAGLNQHGHDAVHVRNQGLANADDPDIFKRAGDEHRTIIAQDLDFGALMAASHDSVASVILLRLQDGRPAYQLSILLKHLPRFEPELIGGTIVVITESRIRIRRWH